MMRVHVCDDTYGAVRWVGSTRIATVFRAVNGLPLWPLNSVFIGNWRKSGVMIPLDGDPKWKLLVVPLSAVHRISIWLTYARVAACLPIVFGAMTFFIGLVMLVTGEQTDIPPKAIVGVSAALMVLGALIGAATYFLAPQVSERERVIRLACDEVFGLAADPAMLDEGFAAYWAGLLEMRLDALGISDFLHAAENPEPYGPETRRLLLVRVRAQVALDPADSRCEQITDRLLPLVPEGREMVRSR